MMLVLTTIMKLLKCQLHICSRRPWYSDEGVYWRCSHCGKEST